MKATQIKASVKAQGIGLGKEKEGEGKSSTKGRNRSMKRSRTPRDSEAQVLASLRASGVVDVVDFAVARAHELRALRSALREKRGTRRVYQALAWHARRRTMSYSARRMPRRLRAMHQAQLAKIAIGNSNKSNKSTLSNTPSADSRTNAIDAKDKPGPKGARIRRKYRGRSRFLSTLRALRLSKPGLLETHVWHAKRFHMTCIAGMRIAEWCNDRGERSALRCAKRACLAYDESFLRVISVQADTIDQLSQKLRSAILTQDDRRRLFAPRAVSGARLVRFVVIAQNEVAIGPVDILRPPERPVAWLWTHPLLAENVVTALNAVGLTANLAVDQPGRFRLIGPSSEKVLAAAIRLPLNPPCAQTAEADLVLTAAFNPSDANSDSVSPPVQGDLWDTSDRNTFAHAGGRNLSTAIASGITVPVLVVQRGSDTGFYGWDIIVPKGWGLPLWLRFMHANRARAAGLREIHALTVGRTSGPLFPEEFVDGEAPRALVLANRQELLDRVARRPPAKRPGVGLGFLAVLSAIQSSVTPTNISQGSDQDSSRPAKRPRPQLPCLPSVASKKLTKISYDVDSSPVRIVRGLCALRAALGRLAGSCSRSDNGFGCDDMFVAVAIRATGRGVPQRDAIVRLRHSVTKKPNTDALKRKKIDGEKLPPDAIGAVVDGAFGLECGRGIGRALVNVSGLRTAADTFASSRKGSRTVSKGRCSATQPEIPVSFQNVADNCVWRDAVVTVVLE